MFLLMFPDRAECFAEALDFFGAEYTISQHDDRFVKVEFEPDETTHFAAFHGGFIYTQKTMEV